MAAPVRGTQSFVGVMGAVWRRPGLTAMEVGWRWAAGAVVLMSVGLALRGPMARIQAGAAGLAGLSVFEPLAAVGEIRSFAAEVGRGSWPVVRWLGPLLFGVWNAGAAVGRTAVLRRLDGTLRARAGTLLALGVLRSGLLAGAWALWVLGLRWDARMAILAPAARGEEPSVVLFAAVMIVGTLLLYVAWGVGSWAVQLAPLVAMRTDVGPAAAVRAALGSGGELRGKVIEINLVMHIVRLCLLVLAMVFCATPLPFSDAASPSFLACWWTGVGLAYLAFSDYFHVVRAAAVLELWGAFEGGGRGIGQASGPEGTTLRG